MRPLPYQIATALRGPDVNLMELKMIFTARLRCWAIPISSYGSGGWCGGMLRVGAITTSVVEAACEEFEQASKIRSKYFRRAAWHWLIHVRDAFWTIKSLKEAGVDPFEERHGRAPVVSLVEVTGLLESSRLLLNYFDSDLHDDCRPTKAMVKEGLIGLIQETP